MMNTRLIRAVIALGATMLMAVGLLTGTTGAQAKAPAKAPAGDALAGAAAGSAAAAPVVGTAKARRNYWGAIAIANRDYAWGVSYDWPRKIGARKRAMLHCRRASNYPGSCKLNMFVVNQCGAYAWKRKPNGQLRWGWGRARLKAPALRQARKRAGGPAGTKILTWVCTTRP